MNLSKLNTIAYRFVAVVICLFLAVGSWAIYENHFYNRAYVGMVAAVIIAVCAFQTPSVKWWIIIIGVLVFAMFLVGVISSYETDTRRLNNPTLTTYYPLKCKVVPMDTLLANPKRFDGKRVSVKGYWHIEFEGDCLYTNKEGYKNSDHKNALWVDFRKRREIDSLNDHFVVMDGIFDMRNKGHMDMNGGSITNITKVSLLPQSSTL